MSIYGAFFRSNNPYKPALDEHILYKALALNNKSLSPSQREMALRIYIDQ